MDAVDLDAVDFDAVRFEAVAFEAADFEAVDFEAVDFEVTARATVTARTRMACPATTFSLRKPFRLLSRATETS